MVLDVERGRAERIAKAGAEIAKDDKKARARKVTFRQGLQDKRKKDEVERGGEADEAPPAEAGAAEGTVEEKEGKLHCTTHSHCTHTYIQDTGIHMCVRLQLLPVCLRKITACWQRYSNCYRTLLLRRNSLHMHKIMPHTSASIGCSGCCYIQLYV
jgi:hypothetical protein